VIVDALADGVGSVGAGVATRVGRTVGRGVVLGWTVGDGAVDGRAGEAAATELPALLSGEDEPDERGPAANADGTGVVGFCEPVVPGEPRRATAMARSAITRRATRTDCPTPRATASRTAGNGRRTRSRSIGVVDG